MIDPAKGQALALRVEDEHGADVSASIVDNPDLQFILVAWDLSKSDTAAFHKILPFSDSRDTASPALGEEFKRTD